MTLADFAPPDSADALDWALAYAKASLAIFPVNAAKAPLTSHGLKDATTDETQIRAWWARHPFADVGWAVPAEYLIVDLDHKHGADGATEFMAREGAHPDGVMTPQASTPSGGRHLVYATNGFFFRNRVDTSAAIDLRTIGGYVVLPCANNGRQWLKPLSTPLAPAPKWTASAPTATAAAPLQAPKPFTGETPYARAALEKACLAIRTAPNGAQQDTLNKEAFSVGGLVGAGDLELETAFAALTAAASAMPAYGAPWGDLNAKVRRSLEDGIREPRTVTELQTPATEPIGLIWYGDAPPTPPVYLVDDTLPETGLATVGGQYGAAKTFTAVDLASAVMIGGDFAGKAVLRQGGVLWLAAEGENEVEMRVQAAALARGADADSRLPFARQAGGVPALGDKNALELLKGLAKQAADRLQQDFKCELAMIAIDTLSAAAGFDDENSAAETQKVMNTLAALARDTKALVLLIDHYGKIIETGVRGSSAKSAANDAILACLGDRDAETGIMTNRKLVVTKLRAGPVGRVVHFDLVKTEDGTTCTVRWRPDEPELATPKGKQWPKALIVFKQALDEALDAAGKTTVPRAGMPEVKAVDEEAVRREFYRLYPGNAEARKKAFHRCAKDAVERRLMSSINTGPDLGLTIFWAPA
jgi:hypothetical protein